MPASVCIDPCLRQLAVSEVELAPLAVLAGERFHDTNSVHRLVQMGVEAAPFLPDFVEQNRHRLPHKDAAARDDRNRGEYGEGQQGETEQTKDRGASQHQTRGQEIRDAFDEKTPNPVRVLRHPAGDLTDLLFVEERKLQVLQRPVNVRPEVFGDVAGKERHVPALERLAQRGDRKRCQNTADIKQQHGETLLGCQRRLGVQDLVRDLLGEIRHGKGRDRRHKSEQRDQNRTAFIGRHVGENARQNRHALDTGGAFAILFGEQATALFAAGLLLHQLDRQFLALG